MPTREKERRRISLRVAAVITLLLAVACSFEDTAVPKYTYTFPPLSDPKHIILFIGDGMQMEYEVAASRYLYGEDYGLAWHKFPYRAAAATWDVNTYNAYAFDNLTPQYNSATFDPLIGYDPSKGGTAPYPVDMTGSQAYLLRAATDSASAATAMATGCKTDSGNISWKSGDPQGGAIITIAELMRYRKAASIGVVSTVPINHATPAAFVSHNVYRNNYSQIADEIIFTTRPEVVIGGGHPQWGTPYVSPSQVVYLRTSGDYVLVERTAGRNGGDDLLSAAYNLPPGKKLFGLFGGPGGAFDPPAPDDNPGSPAFAVQEENPSLAEASEAALTVLSRDPDGFFLMVEQGDIDWANHANNYSWMIGAVWDLEEAVKAAIAFVDRPGDNITWSNTLLIVTADHSTGDMRLTDSPILGAGDLPEQIGATYPGGEVTYGSGGHTNEPVSLSAIGNAAILFADYEGSWYPGVKIVDNTQIFLVMEEAAGIR